MSTEIKTVEGSGRVAHQRADKRYREFVSLRRMLKVRQIANLWNTSTAYVYDVQRRAKLYGYITREEIEDAP